MDIELLYRKYKTSGNISTDTRHIVQGALFFALKGERFNGNEFAEQALIKGASYAVVDEKKWVKDDRYILVEDSLHALQKLARYHRDHLTIPIIALTGSNGKTTTKELVRSVLAKKYNVLATKGNLNNHIGTPLTLLAIDSFVDIAVVEMGANHIGEIATLCTIANPTHGAITNIGKAHLGTFGGFENIIRAKSELYQYLMKKDSAVWVNAQDPILVELSKQLQHPMMYPEPGDYFQCELISTSPYLKIRTETGYEIDTQLVGQYNFSNVALALCIAKFFGVDEIDSGRALKEYVSDAMRSQVITKGTNRIILDAYNANPASMEVAINTLNQLKSNKKIAILGDMYELGKESKTEHLRVRDVVEQYKIDETYLCGTHFCEVEKPGEGIRYFASVEEMSHFIKANPIRHALILVKASRGMELERILDFL